LEVALKKRANCYFSAWKNMINKKTWFHCVTNAIVRGGKCMEWRNSVASSFYFGWESFKKFLKWATLRWLQIVTVYWHLVVIEI
jgi:hypothetical protein